MIYCLFIETDGSLDDIKDSLLGKVKGIYDATDVYMLDYASSDITLKVIETILEGK